MAYKIKSKKVKKQKVQVFRVLFRGVDNDNNTFTGISKIKAKSGKEAEALVRGDNGVYETELLD